MEDAKLNVIVLGNDPQYIQKFRSALTSMQAATSKRTAIQQILGNKYLDPFKADNRKVIGLGIELD